MAQPKIGEVVKGILGRLTSWNLQVGKGVITPKHSYRYPSPGSRPLQPTPERAAFKLPAKQEDLSSIRYEEMRLKHLIQTFAGEEKRILPDDPMVDPRNMFGATFEGLPPNPPVNVITAAETVYNREGIKVNLEDMKRGERTGRPQAAL